MKNVTILILQDARLMIQPCFLRKCATSVVHLVTDKISYVVLYAVKVSTLIAYHYLMMIFQNSNLIGNA
jgi:hypothetical protein